MHALFIIQIWYIVFNINPGALEMCGIYKRVGLIRPHGLLFGGAMVGDSLSFVVVVDF